MRYRRFFTSLFERYQKEVQNAEGIRPSVSLTDAFQNYCQHLTSQPIITTNDADTNQVNRAKNYIVNDHGSLNHITYWEFHFEMQ